MKIDTISIGGNIYNWEHQTQGRLEFLKADGLERRIRLSRRKTTSFSVEENTLNEYSDTKAVDINHKRLIIERCDEFKESLGSELRCNVEINPKTLSATIFVDDRESSDFDVDMVIVSIGEDYQFIRSKCHEEVQIINTYREFGKCGCMLVYQRKLKEHIGNTDNGYITLMKIEVAAPGDKFVHYEVVLTEGGVRYIASEIKSKTLIEKLKDIHQKIQQYRRGFFVKLTNTGVLTDSLQLLNGDMICLCQPEDEVMVDNIISRNSHNMISRSISQEDLNSTDSIVRTRVVNELKEMKCRAIVLYNMTIPKSLMKDLKLLYIFKIDETGKLKTIKTN